AESEGSHERLWRCCLSKPFSRAEVSRESCLPARSKDSRRARIPQALPGKTRPAVTMLEGVLSEADAPASECRNQPVLLTGRIRLVVLYREVEGEERTAP